MIKDRVLKDLDNGRIHSLQRTMGWWWTMCDKSGKWDGEVMTVDIVPGTARYLVSCEECLKAMGVK